MIKVLDYHWHTVHNRRIMKIPWMKVDLFDPRRIRGWRIEQRPYPEDDPSLNFGEWVDTYEPGKYDLVILHIDNWSTGPGKETLRLAAFRYLTSVITDDVPQVVICHGRPNNRANREHVLQVVGDRWLVCNSHKALEEWNIERAYAIWHGYQVDEWPEAEILHSSCAIAVCSGGLLSRDYHGIAIIERLRREFAPGDFVWVGARGDEQCTSFDEYRARLSGARCFVHTTQWAPMSGSRTEAMLCGVPVVSTGHDDEGLFLRDGENAFVTNDYIEMRACIRDLMASSDLAKRIGDAGRETARRLFCTAAYSERWQAFVESKLGLGVGDAG